MRGSVLLALYLGITLLPLGLAAAQGKSPRAPLDEIATGLGLTALAILMVEFLLSGRFRLLSGRIGMDFTLRLHQLLARTSLIFLAVHPFLYHAPFAAERAFDPTAQTYVSLQGAAILTGVASYVGAIVLIVTAIFRDQLPYRYETWRRAHGILALFVVAMGFHHAISAGRYSSSGWLLVFWFLLFGVTLLTVFWVYAFRPMRQKQNAYDLASVRPVADKMWELSIRPHQDSPQAPPFRFEAGQFAWLNVGHSPYSVCENPFSIASSPDELPTVRFLIKELGDFTGSLQTLEPGTPCYLDGPHGHLSLKARNGEGIGLIAGGVGIAPLLSLLGDLDHRRDPRPVRLVYGNRKPAQMFDRASLDQKTETLDFKPFYVLSEPPPDWGKRENELTGLITPECLKRAFPFPVASQWIFFVCGPPAMMEAAEAALIDLGVPAGQIISERFQY